MSYILVTCFERDRENDKYRWMAGLALLCAGSLLAQVSAVVSGTVTDQSGAVVPNATVAATNTETGAVRETDGRRRRPLSVSSLPVGQYEIHAMKTGFPRRSAPASLGGEPERHRGSELQVGRIRASKSPSTGTRRWWASQPPTPPAWSASQIKDLPLNGRSYDELLTLNPGVVNFTWEKTGGIGVSNSTDGQ